jgi:hypothetical protein
MTAAWRTDGHVFRFVAPHPEEHRNGLGERLTIHPLITTAPGSKRGDSDREAGLAA